MLEASAPKVGNVHPGAAFCDMDFGHFVASSIAIGDSFRDASSSSLGTLVLSAVRATALAVGRNTNLGTLLLFAPIALASAGETQAALRERIVHVLHSLSAEDAACVYQAIREANPGGLGQRDQHDVSNSAPSDLLAAMAQVAEFDGVARQYTYAFAEVFEQFLPWLGHELASGNAPLDAICRLQLRLLAHQPDGLIWRKLGRLEAAEVQRRAQEALHSLDTKCGPIHEVASIQQLDHYLRSDGHRRNPGTTADLIAATLLVRLLSG